MIDWTWLPGLVCAQILVAENRYLLGFILIGAFGLLPILDRGVLGLSVRVAEVRESELPGLRLRRGGCPVSPRAQKWIELRLAWLVDEFDLAPSAAAVTVPSRSFYPIAYCGTDGDVRSLARKVCSIMHVDYGRLRISVVEGSHAQARAAAAAIGAAFEGGFDIVVDALSTKDPAKLTAVLAHELGHVRLLGEARIEPDCFDCEQLTDLATVAFGLGVFGANASFEVQRSDNGIGSTSLGYLDQRMWGYALACYAWLGRDREPRWAQSLSENPRAYLRGGLKYLARNAAPGTLPTSAGRQTRTKQSPAARTA
jgi:hypothetical protein